jgi:uncharacterized Zn-binding protein involved in type VI secretion
VFINGRPAARMGDPVQTVLISIIRTVSIAIGSPSAFIGG